MARSIYFNYCIKAIRRIVYGRDNRKPIADAIEEVKQNATSHGYIIKRLDASVEQISDSDDTYRLILTS